MTLSRWRPPRISARLPLPPIRPTQQSTAPEDKAVPQNSKNNGAAGAAASSAGGAPSPAFLGSMLFTRCVSGTRVVPRGQLKSVGGVDFTGYGASVTGYPHDYLTAACALGLSPAELDEFLLRLDKALRRAREERAGAFAAAGQQGLRGVGAGEATLVANGTTDGEATVPEGGNGQHVAAQEVKRVAGEGDAADSTGASISRSNGGGVKAEMNRNQPTAFEPERGQADGDGEEDWDGVD